MAEARPWPAAPGAQPRSSVVLVVCDSLDGRLTFSPGNQTLDLPFINFMKRYGTVFLNAYTNSPICCPSRAAMWSGLFTHLTESWNNFKGLDPNYVTWMDFMENHGYHAQKFGKLDYTSGHHSVRLKFFTDYSSMDHFHGMQSFGNRPLQCGSPTGSQALPANLLQNGLLSLQVHRSCQESGPVQACHRITVFFGYPPVLVWGPPWSAVHLFHGLQADSLPHHGLLHRL